MEEEYNGKEETHGGRDPCEAVGCFQCERCCHGSPKSAKNFILILGVWGMPNKFGDEALTTK
jgi:hypothetical protein